MRNIRLLEEEVHFPTVNLPDLDVPKNFQLITPEIIERAATQLRVHWKLRDLPIPDVTLALENAGVPVVKLDIVSDKQDGFCFRSNCLHRSFVGINCYNVSSARARYDVGHELGHIVLHKNVTAQQSRDPAIHKVLERQAHRFAGAFLFPRSSFLSEIGAPTLDYFCDRKKKWGMSIAAMVFRSADLGLLDEFEKETLYRNMVRRHWRGPLREPFDGQSEMPLEQPRMLRRGLETVLAAGIFGRSAVRSALPLPPREIEQLVGVQKGYLDAADVVELAVPKRGRLKTVDLESGSVLEFPQRKRD